MSIASISNQIPQQSDLSFASSSRTSGSEGGHRHSFAHDLHSLASAIQSGNTSGAQQALATIQQQVPANANATNPLSQFLSNVTTALSNNNIAGAQTALTTFESARRSQATAAAPAPVATAAPAPAPAKAPVTAPAATPAATTTGGLGQDVLSLFTAIGSGDVQGAQSAYDTLTSLLLSGTGASTASQASAASTGAASATPSATGGAFDALLSKIGSALSTGNINTAQTAVDSFLQGITGGSLVSVNA
jgi:hypothetical protein